MHSQAHNQLSTQPVVCEMCVRHLELFRHGCKTYEEREAAQVSWGGKTKLETGGEPKFQPQKRPKITLMDLYVLKS